MIFTESTIEIVEGHIFADETGEFTRTTMKITSSDDLEKIIIKVGEKQYCMYLYELEAAIKAVKSGGNFI